MAKIYNQNLNLSAPHHPAADFDYFLQNNDKQSLESFKEYILKNATKCLSAAQKLAGDPSQAHSTAMANVVADLSCVVNEAKKSLTNLKLKKNETAENHQKRLDEAAAANFQRMLTHLRNADRDLRAASSVLPLGINNSENALRKSFQRLSDELITFKVKAFQSALQISTPQLSSEDVRRLVQAIEKNEL